MAWGGDWQLSDQSTGVGRVASFYFVTACFHNFRRHLLTNPVRSELIEWTGLEARQTSEE